MDESGVQADSHGMDKHTDHEKQAQELKALHQWASVKTRSVIGRAFRSLAEEFRHEARAWLPPAPPKVP